MKIDPYFMQEYVLLSGALRLAHRSYASYLNDQDFDAESRLPGLPYNQAQLFFIAYASVSVSPTQATRLGDLFQATIRLLVVAIHPLSFRLF